MRRRPLALRVGESWLSLLAALLGSATPALALTIDWVPVGDPGNAADTTGFGAVGYSYFISESEVTSSQYAEFLNAVADTDTNNLYHPFMQGSSGIQQFGSSGSFTYVVASAFTDRPITWVPFYSALRFTNWLHNGQPNTGTQTAATTEAGAYTFSGPATAGTRNGGASFFLPSENEWYKAAYYDGLSASYFDYPTSSNLAPACTSPTATPNRANCASAVGATTNAGSYSGSASPYGTFDQGGNVAEWTEGILGSNRVARGGYYSGAIGELAATFRGNAPPSFVSSIIGFRVASVVPEPSTALLIGAGLVAVGALWRRPLRRARCPRPS